MATILPSVVTIPDLTAATTISAATLFEAVQTTGGVVESVKVSLSQIMTTGFGGLPTAGNTGQFLSKLSASDYATQWQGIASALVASTGISIAGSTTATIALASTTPLSVLAVAGAVTAVPLPISGTAAQVVRLNDAGTAVEFGAVNLASSAAVTGVLPLSRGGWSTATLTAFGVVFGNGSSTPGITAAGTTGWSLLGNGTSVAPSFQQVSLTASVTGVLTVPFGGTGTSTLTAFGSVYGNGSSTLGITSAGTTNWVLMGNGTLVAQSFKQVNLTLSVTGTITVPFGGLGFSALATGDLLYASDTTTLARLAISTATQVLLIAAGATTVRYGAVNLTTAVTGTLTVPFGGLGLASLATGDLLYASDTTTLARLASVTTGFVLGATGTVTAPAWTTVIGDNVTWRISTTKAQFGLASAVPAGGSTTIGVTLSSAANLGWFVGTGAPSLSAATGSLYSRFDATTASTRLYINTNGTGTWTNFTTGA